MSDEYREFPHLDIQPIQLLKESKALLGDQYWLFVGIVLVGLLIAGSVPIVLVGPMLCGISACYLRRLRGEPVAFEELFKGFDHFMEGLIATLIITGVSLVFIVPVFIVTVILAVMVENEFLISVLMGFALLVTFFATALVWGASMFVHPLIVDKNMKAVPAVKTSVRAFRANLVPMCILVITMAFLYALGIVMCYFPAFLVAPINLGACMLLYRHLFMDAADASDASDAAAAPDLG